MLTTIDEFVCVYILRKPFRFPKIHSESFCCSTSISCIIDVIQGCTHRGMYAFADRIDAGMVPGSVSNSSVAKISSCVWLRRLLLFSSIRPKCVLVLLWCVYVMFSWPLADVVAIRTSSRSLILLGFKGVRVKRGNEGRTRQLSSRENSFSITNGNVNDVIFSNVLDTGCHSRHTYNIGCLSPLNRATRSLGALPIRARQIRGSGWMRSHLV